MERARITDRDLELLQFIARHRIVNASQAQVLLGISAEVASARVRALARARMLDGERFFERQPRSYWITRRGLAAAASPLPPPRPDLREYRHDLGLGWLWLAARSGAFGPLADLLSERELRSRDGIDSHHARTAGARTEPFAVRLGGTGPGGRERLHYPDLLLIGRDGRRVAIELELTPKTRSRRERILAGYGADRRIDSVLYLVERAGVGRGIRASAARLALRDRVHVQTVCWGDGQASGGGARVAARVSGRARRAELSR